MRTFSKIFDDSIGATFYGQNACQLQNHILRRSPTVQFTGQLHANQFRHLQFPFHAGHHVYRVGTAYTDGNHSQATCIRRMRIGTHHHSARECIVFKHHLMDDSCSRLPEADAVFRSHTFQKVIDFFIRGTSGRQIFFHSFICLNQMVAMYSGRHCRYRFPGIHKLQQCHLCRSILHGYPVGTEIDILFSPTKRSHHVLVVQMGIQYFLGQGHGTSQFFPGFSYFFRIRRIERLLHFHVINHLSNPFYNLVRKYIENKPQICL